MQLGNILYVGIGWEGNTDVIMYLLLRDCLLVCEREGIQPIGALEMNVGTDLWGGNYVGYVFTPDE